jgi:hypothetical protein
MIANAAPDHVELWLVPHAGHTMAWAAAHQEFESRLLGWFVSHPYRLQHHTTQALSKIYQIKGNFLFHHIS